MANEVKYASVFTFNCDLYLLFEFKNSVCTFFCNCLSLNEHIYVSSCNSGKDLYTYVASEEVQISTMLQTHLK